MNIVRQAAAGSLESSDILVTLAPGDGGLGAHHSRRPLLQRLLDVIVTICLDALQGHEKAAGGQGTGITGE